MPIRATPPGLLPGAPAVRSCCGPGPPAGAGAAALLRRIEAAEQGPGGATFSRCRFRAAASVSVLCSGCGSGPDRSGCGSCCGCGSAAVCGSYTDYQRVQRSGRVSFRGRLRACLLARARRRAGAGMRSSAGGLLGAPGALWLLRLLGSVISYGRKRARPFDGAGLAAGSAGSTLAGAAAGVVRPPIRAATVPDSGCGHYCGV